MKVVQNSSKLKTFTPPFACFAYFACVQKSPSRGRYLPARRRVPLFDVDPSCHCLAYLDGRHDRALGEVHVNRKRFDQLA